MSAPKQGALAELRRLLPYLRRYRVRVIWGLEFNGEFLKVHKEQPNLSPNAFLRDYPNERFALDCILDYFAEKSHKEAEDFTYKADEIMEQATEELEAYLQKKEAYTQEYVSCVGGCGNDQYCIEECHRVMCTKDCPATLQVNAKLQGYWEDYRTQFYSTVDNQKQILDDLYAFTQQWFSKIYSPHWSKIYAYEIQSAALGIIGHAYGNYPRAFHQPAYSSCGTDCSVFANSYPVPAEDVDEKEPKENNCPEDSKFELSLIICSMELECESFEFGCSAGASMSLKRNFVNKSTTVFLGVGAEGGLGALKGEAKAGVTMTRHDNGDLDAGVKAEVGASVGAGVSKGKSYEVTSTVMEGIRTETKTVFGLGF